MRKKFFIFLTLIISLTLAGCAAFYSVFGLSHLYAGASTAVIIMASILEASKLLGASLLHSYSDKLSRWMKAYLFSAVIALMVITSAGIYGFLTNAYQMTANKMEKNEGQVTLLDSKKSYFEDGISRLNTQIESKTKRIDKLTDIRENQEVRLDTLYQRRWYSSARRTEKIIEDANEDIKQLEGEIDTLLIQVSAKNDSIASIESKILDLENNSDVAAELGPLKYLSGLTGISMERIINWYTLLLIFVFDPMAVILIVVLNRITEREKKVSPPAKVNKEKREGKDTKGKEPNPTIKKYKKPRYVVNFQKREKDIEDSEGSVINTDDITLHDRDIDASTVVDKDKSSSE